MFEELSDLFLREKNKLINQCARELIEYTGVALPDELNTINILLLAEDMLQLGFKLKWYNNSLVLTQLGDFCEDKVLGYDFSVKVEDNQVSFVAEPLEF